MKRTSILTIDKILLLFLCLAYACAIIVPHVLQTTILNEYRGMQEWYLGPYGFFFLALGITASVPILFRRHFVPSDFFVILYYLVVVMPFIALYSASGYVSDEMLPVSLITLLLPLIIMLLIRNISFMLPKVSLLNEKHINYLLLLLTIVCVIFSYLVSPSSAGFGMADSYDRRLEGRDIFGGFPLFAYILSMCINMFTPFFAFMAGFTKRISLLAVSIIAALFFFWLLGMKAIFLYIIVAYGIGWLMVHGRVRRLPYYILAAMFFLFVISLVELRVIGYSLVADYFFRRIFSAGVQTQGYYLDLIINNQPFDWNFFTGSSNPEFAVTYFVGDTYYGNPLSNENSNAFLYAFGQRGLLGYILAVIIVPSIFLLFDKLYQTHQIQICMFLGFIFATLVLEQAYTTALLSSGVALMTVLVFLVRPGLRHPELAEYVRAFGWRPRPGKCGKVE